MLLSFNDSFFPSVVRCLPGVADLADLGRDLCAGNDTSWVVELHKCPFVLRETHTDTATSDNGDSNECGWRLFRTQS